MFPSLDVIQENFEDVPLDFNTQAQQTFYNVNRPNSSRSLNNISKSKLSRFNYSNSSFSNSSKELLLTPSQRLKIIKHQRLEKSQDKLSTNYPENFNTSDFLSDDVIPDDMIVFDVPSLYSLQTLSTNKLKARKPSLRRRNSVSSSTASTTETIITNTHNINQRIEESTGVVNANSSMQVVQNRTSLLSNSTHSSVVSSPATRTSSIFSHTSDVSDFRSSIEEASSPLSKEVKLLSLNKDIKLEESLQRMTMLKNMSKLSQIDSPTPDTEKIHYLTTTRQQNLPPKTKYEILKHEKDYHDLLEAELYHEQENLRKHQLLQEKLKSQRERDEKSWKKVIDNYDKLVKLPQTRELWWRYVPSKYRYKIWERQIISVKKTTIEAELIIESLEKASEIINDACDFKIIKDELRKKQKEKEYQNIRENISFIEKVSYRLQFAFPELHIFQFGEHFDNVLHIAVAFERLKTKNRKLEPIMIESLINLICVFYYVFQDLFTSLNCFVSLILRKLPFAMLTASDADIPSTLAEDLQMENTQPPYLKDIKDQCDKYLLQLIPPLFNHFVQADINPLKVIQGLTCCFFTNQLEFDIVLRVIDIYLFEGDIMLLRTSLALLKRISYKLYGSNEEVYSLLNSNKLFKVTPTLNVGETTDFINEIRNVLKKEKTQN